MIRAGATVGFVGLGKMGTPMATRLAGAGYRVQGYDVSEQAVRSWAERAEGACSSARLDAAADGATARLWAEAAQALPADADHTEIARWPEP
jgi:3-hydroxyisobutyrate dehydrogenase-like beta-hydroxyacid dehydrogenase